MTNEIFLRSICAIAGENFAVIGADTRLSINMNILSRNQSKLFELTPKAILGSCGSWNDSIEFATLLKLKIQEYEDAHDSREMSVKAIAQFASIAMYNRRFFPFGVRNLLAGIHEGKGFVFSFDVIGHCCCQPYCAAGSSVSLMQPVLDNQISFRNMEEKPNVELTVERAVDLITDCFISAAERDIYTGDSILIKVITQDGVEDRTVMLRKD